MRCSHQHLLVNHAHPNLWLHGAMLKGPMWAPKDRHVNEAPGGGHGIT